MYPDFFNLYFQFQIGLKGEILRSESGKQRVILIDQGPHDSWYARTESEFQCYTDALAHAFPTVSMQLICIAIQYTKLSTIIAVAGHQSVSRSTKQFEPKTQRGERGSNLTAERTDRWSFIYASLISTAKSVCGDLFFSSVTYSQFCNLKWQKMFLSIEYFEKV